MSKDAYETGLKYLDYAMRDTVGRKISIIEMSEGATIIRFSNTFAINFWLTEKYTFHGQSVKIPNCDHVRTFEQLANALGQTVTAVSMSEDWELHVEFANGFALDIGYQSDSESMVEQYELHFREITFVFMFDTYEWWTSNPMGRRPQWTIPEK
jgi:hypothetical protein